MSKQSLVVVYLVIAGSAFAPLPAAAQSAGTEAPPRTAWGDPALDGIWDFRSITPLERPAEFAAREFLTTEEAANLEQATIERELELLHRPARRTRAGGSVDQGEEGALGAYNDFWLDRGTTTVSTRRTSLIVDPADGRLPPLTGEAERRRAARAAYLREHPSDSWEDRRLSDRCMFTTGLPMLPSAYNNNVHVFQTPDHVALLAEMTHTVRIVPLDGRPRPAQPIRQFVGDSRGRWEGDTLVVETMHFNPLTGVRGSTPDAHLVERFTRSGPDIIEYEFTVEDPATWTRPWTARVDLKRTDEPLYEYACHEGNYALSNILAGARAEEREAAQDSRQWCVPGMALQRPPVADQTVEPLISGTIRRRRVGGTVTFELQTCSSDTPLGVCAVERRRLLLRAHAVSRYGLTVMVTSAAPCRPPSWAIAGSV